MTAQLGKELGRRLTQAFSNRRAPLHEPWLLEADAVRVANEVRSGFVAAGGEAVEVFENELRALTAAGSVIAVSSGTAGLILALETAGIGPGDEVLVPSFTFVASANAILATGATPKFVDVDVTSLGIDISKTAELIVAEYDHTSDGLKSKVSGRRLAGILVVHCYGHLAQARELMMFAEDFGLRIIEDAAEALGSFRQGRHAGTEGHFGVLSFNGNKTITAGGGGAVLVNSPGYEERVRKRANVGKVGRPWRLNHDEFGHNFRMPALNAALGASQLERIDQVLQAKQKALQFYENLFVDLEEVNLIKGLAESSPNFWLVVAEIDGCSFEEMEELLRSCWLNNIELRAAWKPLHTMGHLTRYPRADLSNTEFLSTRIVALPSSPSLFMNH